MAKQSGPFLNMMRDAVGGAVAGLIVGLILGLAIQAISFLINPAAMQDGPASVAPFLGMGLGTLVGAILGGLAGMKD